MAQAPRHKVNVFKLLGVLPLVVDAIASIGIDVDTAKSSSSPGGAKVTPDEALELTDKVYASLRPVAKFIVDAVVG